MKKFIAAVSVAAVMLGVVSTAEAGNCAAPVVQQVQQVYAPQAVVLANVVTYQPAAIVLPSAPLAFVQPQYYSAPPPAFFAQPIERRPRVEEVREEKREVRGPFRRVEKSTSKIVIR